MARVSVRQAVRMAVSVLGAALLVAGVLLTSPTYGAGEKQPHMQQRKVVATGAVAELDSANNTLLLSGGAKLATNEGTIASREIQARLGEGNTVETAEARGDVTMDFHYTSAEGVERLMKASADRAAYNAAERTVQLAGHVTADLKEPASQREVKMTADEITFWIDEGRLRIRPAELVFTEAVPAQPESAPGEAK